MAYIAPNRQRIVAEADVVIISAGAIETARLLLASQIGNDQVGRNLQGHLYTGAYGRFEQEVWDGVGPGARVATTRWSHGNDGIIGGGMLCDDFIMLPIAFWKSARPPGTPRWGLGAKQWMRDNYRHVIDVRGPIQDIPSPEARVQLDPVVKDAFGLPVARLSGATHTESLKTAAFMRDRAADWLKAAGAAEIWGDIPTVAPLTGGQHQAGTARMGDDPALSVVDRDCRVHGFDNLYIGDASVHVTNGGFNPFLTCMALAYRTVSGVLARW